MKSKLNIRLLLVCAMVALMGLSAACTREGDGGGGGGTPLEVTHETIRADVRVNIDASLGGMARAMTFVNESDLMELVPVGVSDDDCFDEFGDSCGGEDGLSVDFEDQSDEMAQWLEENVFIDANVEDEAGTTVTYLLPASLFCGESENSVGIAPDPDFDREGGAPEGPGDVPDEINEDSGGDAECERMFSEVPVRLKVTSRRSGDLDLAILVGEGRLSPVSMRIHRNEFAVTLDLGQLKSSAELFAQASDEELELPSVMKGKVEAAVRVSGNSYEAEFSILETIEVLSMSLENPMSIRIGAARPALKAVVNGDARTATLLADFGTLDLMASGGLLGSSSTFCYSDGNGQEICEEEESGSPFGDGPIALHLGGLSATTTFDGNTESLTITNLGLGNDSTTVAVDGQEILSIDLNPNNGRRADVTVSAGDESMEVQFAPAFDLVLDLAMRHLENSEEMPEWAQDENLRVTFDGSSKPTLRSGEGGLQVIEGSLKLSSSTYGVTTINAGQCIIAEDQGGFDDAPIGDQPDEWEDEGPTHPFEGIEGGSCQ